MGGAVKKVTKSLESGFNTTLNLGTLGMSNKVKNYLDPTIPPPPGAPAVAPVADDKAIQVANRRRMAGRASKGRAGTMLTQGDTLG
jgi:hypothetical protein